MYSDGKAPRARGVGLYAREIMARQPLLPVAEEVQDKTRANFCDYFAPNPHAGLSTLAAVAGLGFYAGQAGGVSRLP